MPTFKPNPDKSWLDVPSSREHWYPKWLLFKAKDNGPRSLVLREAVGQQVCDLAIDSGVAIPIQRSQQAVCDGMVIMELHSTFRGLEGEFFYILEKKRETSGWSMFLQPAATTFTTSALGNHANNDIVNYIVEEWEFWYRNNLRSQECADDTGGSVFYNLLLETERFINDTVGSDPVVVNFLNRQSQLHVIPE